MSRFAIILASVLVVSLGSKCNVLVKAGEGDASPYQIGALKGLLASLPGTETGYNLVSGISAGAINAAVMSHYPIGAEQDFVGNMTEFWNDFSSDKFYTDRPDASLLTWINQPGYYDTTPMNKTLTSLLGDEKPTRNLIIGTTDLVSGEYISYSSHHDVDWVAATMGSMAISGWFPYVKYQNFRLVDGASYKAVDMVGVIDECRSLGYGTDQIHVDVVIASKLTLSTADASNYNTIQVLKRFFSVSSFKSTMMFVDYAKDGYFGKGVTLRTIYPSKDLPNSEKGFYKYTKEEVA
jgi:hypothetical protein